MHFFTCRVIKFVLITTFLFILSTSCEKDKESKNPPVISLKTAKEYTQNNDTVLVGQPLVFGIQANGTSASITNLVVKKIMPDNTYKVVMDTGLFSMELNIDKIFYQNMEDEAEWTFTVMDRNKMQAEVSLTVYKDPNSKFGGIIFHPSITMGFQENNEHGHFLDLKNGLVYSEDSAKLFQDNIDLLTYYIIDDDQPSPVFSSPGEYDNFSTEAAEYYSTITDWGTRNYTLWDISVDDNPVSVEDYDNCHNDSLIIAEYDEVWGKKKFKWATVGRVIPFQTNDGTRGLLKVLNAEHANGGSIVFSVKMQQK